MDFDQFKIQVVDEMRECFPDLYIGIQAVSKLQGESYTGLAVSPADTCGACQDRCRSRKETGREKKISE